MKRAKLLLVGLIAALPVLTWAAVAHAHSFHSGDNVSIAKNQIVDKTLFATGRTIDIAGKVNGDVFCAGQNVTITGTVTGDVFCAGQNVRIAGMVEGSVRVAGQNVTLGGTVARNLTAAAQSFTNEGNGKVSGDATIGGQDAVLNGSIGRDLAIGSQTVTINNLIGRDVQAADTDLTLGNNAKINGSLQYTSEHILIRNGGSQVLGSITRKEPAKREHHARVGAWIHMSVWFALYMFVSLLVVALILVLLIPQAFHAATDVAVRSPLKTALVGFLGSIITPVVVVLLMITVIGIPLGLLLLTAWLLAMALSGAFAAYYTGRLLMMKSTNSVLIMLLGAVVLLVLYIVPILGGIVWLVAGWFGLGIVLLQAKRLPKPHYEMAQVGTVATTEKSAKKKH